MPEALQLNSPIPLISHDELLDVRSQWAEKGERVAFVPTMGALHQGHLALVRRAKELADRVMVSIFVNPLQFGPNEDFGKYPRTLKADLDLLGLLDTDAVFLPNATTMYPDGFQTALHNSQMASGLCGASRKGHFDGVLTVVLKLFNIVRPHFAVFGKKDYQQWRLIERMVEDLNVPLDIVGCETLREPDGLAMSSRNRYLSDTERPLATRLFQGLSAAKSLVATGEKRVEAILAAFRKVAGDVQGLDLEYVEVRTQKDLVPLDGQLTDKVVMLVAARVGTTRLIDNLELN